MYELIKKLLFVAVIIIGIVMVIKPQLVVKNEWKDSTSGLLKGRIMGVLFVIAGIVLILFS